MPDLSQAGGSGTTRAVMPFSDCSSAQPSASAGAGRSWRSSQSLHTPSYWWLIAGAQRDCISPACLTRDRQSRKGEKAKVTDRAGDRERTWSGQWARPQGWGRHFESWNPKLWGSFGISQSVLEPKRGLEEMDSILYKAQYMLNPSFC